jgi:ankyrin repeat protein
MNTQELDKIQKELIIACIQDDFISVKNILEKNPNLDLNFEYYISKSGGNGTPLILTGKKEIAELLLKHGADINYKDKMHNGITALDSAIKTRDTKTGYRKGEEKHDQICELISYLLLNNAKQSKDL